MNGSQGLQQAKSARARDAICDATIESLAIVGYAETSLKAVATAAGFSKGALQHHFPSKEDLIAETVDRLLHRTTVVAQKRAKRGNEADSVEEALMIAWRRFINTRAYLALMEILIAARTDEDLKRRISNDLLRWGQRLDQSTLDVYESVNGGTDEAVMLMNMTRSFMRGLLIQERYGITKEQTLRYVNKWIELVAPLLRLKETTDDGNDT
mgnify:FL=1